MVRRGAAVYAGVRVVRESFMRLVIAALVLSLTGMPVQAQTSAQAPAQSPAQSPATTPAAPPAVMAPAMPAPAAPAAAKRMTARERFIAANTTHDGHLTRAQAQAGKMTYTARHFDAIDSAKKGYVTQDDITAYARAQRTARKATRTTPRT